jgi:hypothetical protein
MLGVKQGWAQCVKVGTVSSKVISLLLLLLQENRGRRPRFSRLREQANLGQGIPDLAPRIWVNKINEPQSTQRTPRLSLAAPR